MGTLLYCIRQGIKNIGRKIWISLVSTASISACIFLFCLFFAVIANVRYIVRNAEAQVAVSAFFDAGLTEEEILAVKGQIEQRPEVREVTYISADEAWENFQKEYFKDNEELAKGFANDNPLANSASCEIHLNSIEAQSGFVAWLQEVPGVRKVNYSMDTAAGLIRFNKLISAASAVIIGILLAVSVFLISNTISTAAAFRKDENRIMRLIGATNFMIRAPFVVEGILIGLAGAVIPLTICYFMYRQAVQILLEKFNILSSIVDFLPVEAIFPTMAAVALALGVGIGFIGSFFTIRKHLKV